MTGNISKTQIDIKAVEEKARKSLELMRPYLQAEGHIPAFHSLDEDTLYITIQTKNLLSFAEMNLIKLGIEKKILEEIREIKRVKLS